VPPAALLANYAASASAAAARSPTSAPQAPAPLAAGGLCSECDVAEANCFCSECAADLCDDCAGELHRFRATQQHLLVPLADKAARLQRQCAEHAGQTRCLFCVGCAVPVCALCTVETHTKHDVHSLATVAQRMKALSLLAKDEQKNEQEDELLPRQLGGKSAVATLSRAKQQLQQRQTDLTTQAADATRAIDAACDALLAAVNARRAELKRHVQKQLAAADSSAERLLNSISLAEQAAASYTQRVEELKQMDDFDAAAQLPVLRREFGDADPPVQQLLQTLAQLPPPAHLSARFDSVSLHGAVCRFGSVSATPLSALDSLCDCWDAGRWRVVRVVGNEAGRIRVHYLDWDARFDEWIRESEADTRLRPLRQHSKGYTGHPQLPEHHRSDVWGRI